MKKQNHQGLLVQVLFSLVLLWGMGCKGQGNPESEPLLEGVLDAYISYYSVDKSRLIDITDMAGWTDSSSVLVVRSYDKRKKQQGGEYLQAEYQGIEIRLLQGRLSRNGSSINNDVESIISNNLEWQLVREDRQQTDENELPPP